MTKLSLTVNFTHFDEVDFRGINHGEFAGWNDVNSFYDAFASIGAIAETGADWVFDGLYQGNYYIEGKWSNRYEWILE
ncbi:MAG: hypothetical protein WC789_10245 [Lentisphaeria bacterium]|jgi:hypothetical protein